MTKWRVGVLAIALGSACWADDLRSITVVGEGRIKAAPDQALVSLQVERLAPKAAEAQQQVDQLADKLVALARESGLQAEAIDASEASVRAEYDWQQQKRVYRGMAANRTVRLSVRGQALAPLMDRLLASDGGLAADVSWGFADERGLRQQALDNALLDAKAKAERLARGAGGSLGRPLEIVEQGAEAPRPMPRMALKAEAMGAAPMDMPVGERSLEARLVVSYELLP